jgi:hypothetical protein
MANELASDLRVSFQQVIEGASRPAAVAAFADEVNLGAGDDLRGMSSVFSHTIVVSAHVLVNPLQNVP